jgi:hypothetical protein
MMPVRSPFSERQRLRRPSAAIRRALATSGLRPEVDPAALGVVVTSGTFSDRPVTLFRVFVPERAAARGVDVLSTFSYDELNAHLDLVLRSGYLEPDGQAVIFSPADAPKAAAPPPA